jgi:hypothetical protein
MQNVDVKELFRSFNNFGMESLTHKNISGSFSADINLTSMLDGSGNLYKPANKGWVDFSLKNGRLENFQPLMDIDNNFLQKRDLSNVSFAELKDRLDLNGNDILVNAWKFDQPPSTCMWKESLALLTILTYPYKFLLRTKKRIKRQLLKIKV